MNKRRITAASALATLPVMMLMVQSAILTTPLTDFAYALGMSAGWSLAFGVVGAIACAFFSGPAGAACGIAGAV